MMDAVEFLKKQKRICDSHDSCFKCQLKGKCDISVIKFDKIKDCVNIVEQWSKEHHIKTNRDALIDLVEDHFGSNYGWSSNGLDDSISLYFTNGFLDEEYKGKSLEQTEDKLSFKEVRELLAKMCGKKSCRECVLFEKTIEVGDGCKKWCFDHPEEAQEIALDWKKEQKEGESK